MKTLGFLLAVLLLEAEGSAQPIVAARPTVYPHLLDPTVYPDYTRRPSRVPTWGTFEGRPQFVALRTLPTPAFTSQGLGTVCMPTIDLVSNPHLGEALDELKRRGYFLFDVGGFVPGSVPNQVRVRPETLRLLEETLGDRFLGFDVGEQDGRYLFTARAVQSPYASDRLGQYFQAHDYFRGVMDHLGNRLNALMVYWYWPYLIKEGRVVLAGAEAQNKVTSSSIHNLASCTRRSLCCSIISPAGCRRAPGPRPTGCGGICPTMPATT